MYKIILPFLFLLVACSENEPKKVIKQHQKEEVVGPKFSYRVNFLENKGWGYQIFEGAKLLINQEHIPAVQGLHYFSTKENAETMAKYILAEVEKGNFPPTVTEEILDSLKVLE